MASREWDIDLYSTFGPVCPRCKHEHAADEPFYFDESNDTFRCERCNKDFICRIYTQTSWTSEPVERCSYCDGTGDVHRADGEWLGECDCRAKDTPS